MQILNYANSVCIYARILLKTSKRIHHNRIHCILITSKLTELDSILEKENTCTNNRTRVIFGSWKRNRNREESNFMMEFFENVSAVKSLKQINIFDRLPLLTDYIITYHIYYLMQLILFFKRTCLTPCMLSVTCM